MNAIRAMLTNQYGKKITKPMVGFFVLHGKLVLTRGTGKKATTLRLLPDVKQQLQSWGLCDARGGSLS